mgnify:CR=1 FL=1
MLRWLLTIPLIFLASCQKESQVDRATREGVLLVGNANEPKGLDPHIVSGVLEANILRALFEGLIGNDPQSDTATPGGAALQVTPDATATVWTAKLRPDGKWSDGVTVTAQDFAFSYQRILTPELGAKYSEMLYFLKGAEDFNKGKTKDFSTVGVEVVDDETLRLTLRGPTPYFREILKHYTWTAVPRHVVLKHGKIGQRGNPWTRPENLVSNGPYQLKSWRRNDHIEVERNPHYWNAAKVTLNGVRFLPVSNLYTEARMFRDGQLHMTYAATPEVVDLMKKENPAALRQEPYVGTVFYRFNTTRKPLDDPRVRQALSMAIDREAIKRNIMRGLSIPAGLMVAPGVNGNTPDIDVPIKTDSEGAKKLLAEAGYPDGFEVRMNCPNNRYVNDEEICQAVIAMWARIGVKIQLVAENMATFSQKFQNFDSSLYLLGWGVATYDAQYMIQSLVRTRTSGADGNFNFSRISDPTVDRLTDAMKSEVDVAKRNAMIKEALLRIKDEVLVIPIHHQMRPWAMKAGVSTVHRSDDRPEARFTSMR